jgi:hypothetical protein
MRRLAQLFILLLAIAAVCALLSREVDGEAWGAMVVAAAFWPVLIPIVLLALYGPPIGVAILAAVLLVALEP